uniref:Prefoldin subunit 3 n=1 Tax=Phallusia mammillata TaxID=59560 RepID=A0A6F9DWQ5_9ASCI|nr:prefoldin subunit 3-like [Phallusia mammillata]
MTAEVSKHLGIPEAVFVTDVDSFMKEMGTTDAESLLRKLEENYQKYKMMEITLLQKKKRLQHQIPELKSTLDIVKHLHEKKTGTEKSNFLLSAALYAKAEIPPTEEVFLWLGANVMLSYSTSEALDLLSQNNKSATKNLTSIKSDLEYLRDQITTTEVTMARLYNWNVKKRRTTAS